MSIIELETLKSHLTTWRVNRLTERARGVEERDIKPHEPLQAWLKQPCFDKAFLHFGFRQGMALLLEEQWHVLKGVGHNAFVEGVARAILHAAGEAHEAMVEPKILIAEAMAVLKMKHTETEDLHF